MARARDSVETSHSGRDLAALTLSPSGTLAAMAGAEALPPTSYNRMRRMLRVGVVLSTVPFLLLVAGVSLIPIPGATIASGYLTSESSPKEIQSPQTAVVKAIHVKDGDLVNAGDRLIEFDDTSARAELAIATRSRDQSAARIARLSAEALNLSAVTFPPDLMARANDPDIAAMMTAEGDLFKVRLEAYKSQLDQMNEQSRQIASQVAGVSGQIAAANHQHQLIAAQVANLQSLREQKLIAQSQLTDTERDLATVDGQLAQFNSTIATAKGKEAELSGEIAELLAKRMSDAAEQERETQGQFDEASQKQIAARMTAQLFVLTAPQSGVVTDLKIRTIGGVVSTSETLMTIVPRNDRLIAELDVSPRDAPKIHVGQPAELHLTAVTGTATPEFAGKVTFVAPDLVYDQRTGVPHFVVRVAVGDPINEAGRNLKQFGSGMPVDVYVIGEAQSIIGYIGKPIIEQAQRAFR
jgi:HlyD family secretion protein